MSLELFKELTASLTPIETQYSSAEWGGLDVWKFQEDNYVGKFLTREGNDVDLIIRTYNEVDECYETEFLSSLDLRDGEVAIRIFMNAIKA